MMASLLGEIDEVHPDEGVNDLLRDDSALVGTFSWPSDSAQRERIVVEAM